MKDNYGALFTQQIEDFDLLLNISRELDYSNKEIILQLEKQTYSLLKELVNDSRGLIILAQIQLMLGNRSKAVAIAHNIWDTYGDIDELYLVVYIDILMNLGLMDMANSLLKDRIDSIENDEDIYFYVAFKYAIIVGDVGLISRLLNLIADDNYLYDLYDFVGAYRIEDYELHYKNIQKIVLDVCKNSVCSFDYAVYTDRDFTDLEFFIYVGNSDDCNAIFNTIEKKINEYCFSNSVERIHNLCFTVSSIEEHPPLMGSLQESEF